MAYIINSTNGSVITTVADGTIDQQATSITLVGQNYAGYGEFLNENFVKLLENFSSNTAPAAPLAGQLWWDTTTGVLKAYTGVVWKNIPSTHMGSSQPVQFTFGDLWWDTTSNQLKVCDQAGVFKPAGGSLTLSGDITGTGSGAVTTALSTTGVTAGNYGTASSTPVMSVDAKGRITSASNTSINITSSQVSNFAATTRTSVSANSGLTYNSTTGVFGVDTSVIPSTASGGAALVGYTAGGTGAVTTTVQSKLREHVCASDFGAVGDGSDETTKLQNALNAATGKTLELTAGAIYQYTALTINPNTRVITNGASFNRIAASTTHGIAIKHGVYVDNLIITTPGGASGDKAVVIHGSNVTIGAISIIASAQGIAGGVNWAVEIGSNPANVKLENIFIGGLYVKYFSTGVFAKYVDRLTIKNVLIEYYRTGIYLRDVSQSIFDNVTCRFVGASAVGGPGENGLLVESTLSSGASNDLRFYNWSVANSAEHGYRFGGSLMITDVWLTNCRSALTGAAGAAATGGSGFKVLGYGGDGGEVHKNFYFSNCKVSDVSTTGSGLGNFAGFLFGDAINIHMSQCAVIKRNNPYSCWHGISADSVRDLFITNSNVRDCRQHAIRLSAGTSELYPNTEGVVDTVTMIGGRYGVSSGASLAIRFDWDSYTAGGTMSNLVMNGVTISGGLHALRAEAGITYTNNRFDFRYINCDAVPDTAIEPVVYGVHAGIFNIAAPWHKVAYSPPMLGGSVWQDTAAGAVVREYRGSTWVERNRTYSVTVPNNGVATIVPPTNIGSSPGFLAITGNGAGSNMLVWFRASIPPLASKYAGAATSDVVATTLTGTTGTAGNLTVGVQPALLYIENRTGSDGTFLLTFW